MAIADIRNRSIDKVRKGPPCEVCAFIESLSKKDAAAMVELLSDPTVRYTSISEELAVDADTPVELSAFSLSWHARGKCRARVKLR